MQINKKLNKLLRQRRLEKGLTQLDLARKVGYTAQFVANWERCVCAPPIKALPKIAKLLDIPPDQIIDLQLTYTRSEWNRIFKTKH